MKMKQAKRKATVTVDTLDEGTQPENQIFHRATDI